MLRTLLLAIVVFVLMASMAAYAATEGSTEDQTGVSPASGPVTIGWILAGNGRVDGVSVTWTPIAASVYTIEATVGDSSTTMVTPLTGTSERTDIIRISPIGAEVINNVNVAIVES